ncbi:unnamed protein product [Larinioides sclopetarius]|uniref:Uncharacterized protein n=1 Tax=Larinioides sclopetarius TaxID=280406 RepID=A0AAV1ZIL4_9ARAC
MKIESWEKIKTISVVLNCLCYLMSKLRRPIPFCDTFPSPSLPPVAISPTTTGRLLLDVNMR